MSSLSEYSRRRFLRDVLLAAGGLALAACKPGENPSDPSAIQINTPRELYTSDNEADLVTHFEDLGAGLSAREEIETSVVDIIPMSPMSDTDRSYESLRVVKLKDRGGFPIDAYLFRGRDGNVSTQLVGWLVDTNQDFSDGVVAQGFRMSVFENPDRTRTVNWDSDSEGNFVPFGVAEFDGQSGSLERIVIQLPDGSPYEARGVNLIDEAGEFLMNLDPGLAVAEAEDEPTVVFIATAPELPTEIDTPVPPTSSRTPTATDTAQPTASDTATATDTPIPPTASRTATQRPTPTVNLMPSSTPIPPTATASNTPFPSPTPIPPTMTPVIVEVPTATFTPEGQNVDCYVNQSGLWQIVNPVGCQLPKSVDPGYRTVGMFTGEAFYVYADGRVFRYSHVGDGQVYNNSGSYEVYSHIISIDRASRTMTIQLNTSGDCSDFVPDIPAQRGVMCGVATVSIPSGVEIRTQVAIYREGDGGQVYIPSSLDQFVNGAWVLLTLSRDQLLNGNRNWTALSVRGKQ